MRKPFLLVFLLSLVLVSSSVYGQTNTTEQAPEAGVEAKTDGAEDNFSENVIVHKGVRVEFDIEPIYGSAGEPGQIIQGDYAEVRFRITDVATGAPIFPLEPAVWISRIREMDDSITCRERISQYTQGTLSFQADIDLNKYFILIMNNDNTISVVDPLLGVIGITKLFAMIILDEPGEDWIQSPDGKHMFVTMPKAYSVAVVNLEDFKVIRNVETGSNPARVTLQPDGKYLWVGNDGEDDVEGTVTIIDAQSYEVVAQITTGAGHHEIAFSTDSLFAFVTNNMEGTLSVIDTQKLEKIKDLSVGKYPVAVQYSNLSQVAYVASMDDGAITVVDGAGLEITGTIQTQPGLNAMRLAPGGRWLFTANNENNRVDIIDTSQEMIAHSLKVGDQPYQFAFTDAYGYVRHLGTPDVILVPLAQLDRKDTLGLQTVVIGSRNPGDYPFHAISDSISPTGEWTAVLAINPADKMVYYYMEGMIAPMGSYSTYGRVPRAVGVVDRSLKEIEKGVYGAKIRVPDAGIYSVAFLIDSPWVHHCFTFNSEPNPLLEAEKKEIPVRLEFLNEESRIPINEPFKVRFLLTGSKDGKPLSRLKNVLVLVTRMPGNWQRRMAAKPVGDGNYEVSIVADQPGVYLIAVGVPSLKVYMTELPYLSFRAIERKTEK